MQPSPAEPYRPNAPHPTPLGVMQGRVVPPDQGRFQSFPRSRWRDEFPRAAQGGGASRRRGEDRRLAG